MNKIKSNIILLLDIIASFITIIIVLLILTGAFLPSGDKNLNWIFFGAGAVIFAIVSILTLSDVQFTGNLWWDRWGIPIIWAIVIATALITIVSLRSKDGE